VPYVTADVGVVKVWMVLPGGGRQQVVVKVTADQRGDDQVGTSGRQRWQGLTLSPALTVSLFSL